MGWEVGWGGLCSQQFLKILTPISVTEMTKTTKQLVNNTQSALIINTYTALLKGRR